MDRASGTHAGLDVTGIPPERLGARQPPRKTGSSDFSGVCLAGARRRCLNPRKEANIARNSEIPATDTPNGSRFWVRSPGSPSVDVHFRIEPDVFGLDTSRRRK